MEVTVLNRQRKLIVDAATLRKSAEMILAGLGRPEAELTVTLVSDARMRELNRTYRGLDAPTDVLSFSQTEGEPLPHADGAPEVLGDVVLSAETAARQAGDSAPPGLDAAAALQRELTWLLLHGVLHLVGHDHDADADHERMEAEAQSVWPTIDVWSGPR
jgi:probable rRNA maturation factor